MYVQCTSFRSHSGKYLADDFLLGIQFARNRPKQMKKVLCNYAKHCQIWQARSQAGTY